MGQKTRIDWCDATWNPVTGCLHGCEYCYAKRIARRFCTNEYGKDDVGVAYPCSGDCQFCSELDGLEFVGTKMRWNNWPKYIYPFGFWPTFHPHRLDIPARWTRPRTIFVCSMADLFGIWVPDDIIKKVFDACRKAPQHRYLFLTKNPERYKDICLKDALPYGPGFWYGTTTTRPTEGAFIVEQEKKFYHTFLSIEPIQERFGQYALNRNSIMLTDWVIIGAETGNRKDKVIPEKEWIDEIAEVCKKYEKPIFMKESLREIMGPSFVQEFPW